MARLILRVIIAGLAASISPVAVMVLLSIMMKKNARRNSLMFLLGYTLVLIFLGIAGVLAFRVGGSRKKSTVDGYIDIALGALCILAILLNLRPKKKEARSESGAGGSKASRAFLLGSITMLVNMSTIICFVSGAHEISAAKPGLAGGILAMVLLISVTLLTVIIPIIAYVIFPKGSDRVLEKLNAWLSRHNKVIEVVVLLVFGAYLLTKGIRILV